MFALKSTRVLAQTEVEALLARMRQRVYPESIPVLASYWLKTVYAAGHNRWWWKDLSEELKRALREERLDERQRTALTDIQTWIRGAGLLTGKTPESKPGPPQPFRPGLTPESITPYIVRLLNEWLPAEVAHMLADETEPGVSQESGMPVLTIGLALERLLTREHLSPASLEMLLQPELVSPRHVYALDVEILHDVVLSLLGRTSARRLSVMPATVLGVASTSPLPPEYPEAVRSAFLLESTGREELHVPLTEAQAEDIFRRAPVRTGSMIVTMDGRCWESESVEGGEQAAVIHRPIERLRIDFTAEHAKLEIPWPETQLSWRGDLDFPGPLELFGREWRVSSWETDGESTRLRLAFSGLLPIPSATPSEDTVTRRARTAYADMAWTALENALAASVAMRGTKPLEMIRHAELIPLGRAMFALADSARNRRLPKRETLETQLRAIRYLESEVSLEYGLVPWRVLPAAARVAFLKSRPDIPLLRLLNEVFDELPDALRIFGPTSPPQAA